MVKEKEDKIECVMKDVAESLTATLGQGHGFVLCVVPAGGTGRMYCMTDLHRDAVMHVMAWVRSKVASGDEPTAESEVLH